MFTSWGRPALTGTRVPLGARWYVGYALRHQGKLRRVAQSTGGRNAGAHPVPSMYIVKISWPLKQGFSAVPTPPWQTVECG